MKKILGGVITVVIAIALIPVLNFSINSIKPKTINHELTFYIDDPDENVYSITDVSLNGDEFEISFDSLVNYFDYELYGVEFGEFGGIPYYQLDNIVSISFPDVNFPSAPDFTLLFGTGPSYDVFNLVFGDFEQGIDFFTYYIIQVYSGSNSSVPATTTPPVFAFDPSGEYKIVFTTTEQVVSDNVVTLLSLIPLLFVVSFIIYPFAFKKFF